LIFLFSLWKQFTFFKQVTIIFFTVQLIFATRPWFEYTINFIGTDEVWAVSSKINLFFIFISLINLFLLFSNSSISNILILLSEVIMAILFVVGYNSPTSVHIDFIKNSDYRYNTNFYIFGIALIASLLVSIRNFLKERNSNNPREELVDSN
ncbi:MAG TPA: hypothetical protein PKX55_21015, partial [Leptospiraceae bacterium]|nr:hypothetical protein [Leptospiraceae bacterium]